MKILVCSPMGVLNNSENPEFQFFNKKNIEKIESKFDVVWNKLGRQFTKEELIEKIADCDAILTCWGSNKLDADIVAAAPNLKIMAHLAGTVVPYVSEALYNSGVKVIGANDKHFAESVAEAALLYTLISLRRIKDITLLIHEKKEGGWYKKIGARGIFDRTIGIVSFGAIAEHFVKILQPFHCKIKVYSRSINDKKLQKYNMKKASLDEIFSTCYVISIHTAFK